ncbi:unnamed protein product [Notodromas monacha]|uniref:Mediator of RNA polymerase II transcription subunit 6 n=1 Tax=Notodromas monacha TaxID=399045 RepID=A0A7R9BHN6_9CRUS|nr:unnamed protein product [Notodromas monacha]CAG0915424.1 unnamed protein product [Notodromas monacha]
MMRGMGMGMGIGAPKPISSNLLGTLWHNSVLAPQLSALNVLDYFANHTNPFYDRTCNNEIIKMQRLSLEHLSGMTGVEYVVLHTQEPILYIIRKQNRTAPNQVTPLNDYYIIAGQVYQAPDLGSIINSRVVNIIHHLESALDETMTYSRFHPSRGYWWEFPSQDSSGKKTVQKKPEDGSSAFQRMRVDKLLNDWAQMFPPKIRPPIPPNVATPMSEASGKQEGVTNGPQNLAASSGGAKPTVNDNSSTNASAELGGMRPVEDIKEEKGIRSHPPPEKKRRLDQTLPS